MRKMKKLQFMLVISILLFSCEDNMTNNEDKIEKYLIEAWYLYQGNIYVEAIDRFNKILELENKNWQAHLGLGWSHGRLGNLEDAAYHFSKGIEYNNVDSDLKAGLSFVYNAQDLYEKSNQYAYEVLQNNVNWKFTYDELTDWHDLRILKAMNYFALGEYNQSLQEVQILDSGFVADLTNPEGIAELAEKIESLREKYN